MIPCGPETTVQWVHLQKRRVMDSAFVSTANWSFQLQVWAVLVQHFNQTLNIPLEAALCSSVPLDSFAR